MVIEDDNLNIAIVNSGVILDFIKAGINTGANKVHFDDVDVKKILEIATPNIDSNINITNDALLFCIKLNIFADRTVPIFVYLNQK